jgi:P pilus assembly protein, pilin FimA
MLIYKSYYRILCSGLATALLSSVGYADQNVDITANVINNSCQLEVSDNGVVNLPTVKMDYFSDNVTAETDYPGGKEFNVHLIDCPTSDALISQIIFSFTPQEGTMPTGNKQVFDNALQSQNYAAKNIGITIFSSASNATRQNVIDADGSSRAVYTLPSQKYSDSTWTFYARMQKIMSGENIKPGLVSSHVFVNVSYK